MLQACERMLGPQDRCVALELSESMGKDELAGLIEAALAKLGPALIMVDMLGGTPWNAALLKGLPEGVEILSGLSLPLLLEALALRDSLEAPRLGAALKAKGREASVLASELLGGRRP